MSNRRRLRPRPTDPTPAGTAASDARREKRFNLISIAFFRGSSPERLQISRSPFRVRRSSMNDFPRPEDPLATMTMADELSASLGEVVLEIVSGTRVNFQGGYGPDPCSTQPIRRNMNSQNNHEIIVSGIHLELTPSLKTFVREKTERLFRHEERIVRVRMELECDRNAAVGMQFKAKGHIIIHGPDMNATVQSDDCHKAISMLVDKLDRMLQRRHQLHRVKRNHPHAVEFGAALPKVV